MQLQAREVPRIDLRHRAVGAGGEVHTSHDRHDLRLVAEIHGHEQRARDGLAVELDLPVVGAAARADFGGAELLPERGKLADLELRTGERCGPLSAAARSGAARSAARQGEPLVDVELAYGAVHGNAAVGPKLRQRAAEPKRRTFELELVFRTAGLRIEVERKPARDTEIALHLEAAVRRKRELDLEIGRLARRLLERRRQAQRDAGQVRVHRDVRLAAVLELGRRNQERAFPTRLAGDVLRERQIERGGDGVDRDLAVERYACAIARQLRRVDARGDGAVEENRADVLAAQRAAL